MISIGFTENMKGLFISVFKNEFNVSNASIGLVITVSSIGYILFQFIGGTILEQLEHRRVFFISIITIIVACGILYISNSFMILLIGMFVLNAGFSLYSISTNSLNPVLFVKYQVILMNITYFCYGLGASFGQRFTGLMLQSGIGWRDLYLLSGGIFAVLLVIFFFVKMPSPDVEAKSESISFGKVISNKLVLLYIVALGFYAAADLSVGNWFANFLESSYLFDKERSSFYLSLFFLIFTIGRFVGGFIVEKIGHFKSLKLTLITAIVLFTIGLIGGKNTVLMVSISGIFFSICFPTLIVIISNTFKQNTSYIIGIIMTFALTINMLLNILIGLFNDQYGTFITFFLIPICLFISLIAVVFVTRDISKEKTINVKQSA